MGGQFWDGRAIDLVAQAKGPFLNPLEMNNPSKQVVVDKVATSKYASLFKQVYGASIFQNVEKAYDSIADAIAAFEQTDMLNRFGSKYDLYLAGQATLTAQEKLGLQLFEGKAKCALCHVTAPDPVAGKPMLTDFTYDNLGVPKNPKNPFYSLPPQFNPEGKNWVDYGLGSGANPLVPAANLPGEKGKFKVPTLRNVGITGPYVHNGVFNTLKEVVHFYNTRDVPGMNWPAPEVSDNVNRDELGNLGLTPQEEDAVVAFMMTLTDGHGQGPHGGR